MRPEGWRAGRPITSQKSGRRERPRRHRDATAGERGRHDLLDLGALEPVWDELFPAEQARIIQLLVARVVVRLDGLEITLRADGIVSVLEELRRHEGAERQAA
jgi:hypothetical protein